MNTRHVDDHVLKICDEHHAEILSIKEMLSDDGSMVIVVSGEIKNEVAHEFEDEVMAALSVCKHIVLDMGQVSYIASMALKSLLSIQQIIDETENASMVLTHLSPEVTAIFKESGFSEILLIQPE